MSGSKKILFVRFLFASLLAASVTFAWAQLPSEDLPTPIPSPTESPAEADNIIQAAQRAGGFDTFLAAIERANLTQTLAEQGPYTVFAPTNAAFEKIPADQLQSLLNNPEQLSAVLQTHVVSGELPSEQLVGFSSIQSLSGYVLSLTQENGQLRVDQARVVRPDIDATNGVIHGIDAVLFSEQVTPQPGVSPTVSPTPALPIE